MKKILGLTVSALMVMALVGGGTWAYFSDPETSTGNVLSAGTLDLKLNGTNGVSGTLNLQNLAPGDYVPSADDATILLTNDGSLNGGSLSISLSYAESDNTTLKAAISGDTDLNTDLTADQFAAGIELITLSWNGTSRLSLVSDANSNSIVDLQDFVLNSANFTALSPGIAAGDTSSFKIRVRLPTSANNTFMADGISANFTFTLQQQ